MSIICCLNNHLFEANQQHEMDEIIVFCPVCSVDVKMPPKVGWGIVKEDLQAVYKKLSSGELLSLKKGDLVRIYENEERLISSRTVHNSSGSGGGIVVGGVFLGSSNSSGTSHLQEEYKSYILISHESYSESEWVQSSSIKEYQFKPTEQEVKNYLIISKTADILFNIVILFVFIALAWCIIDFNSFCNDPKRNSNHESNIQVYQQEQRDYKREKEDEIIKKEREQKREQEREQEWDNKFEEERKQNKGRLIERKISPPSRFVF